jgi:broad specificity phosphatase PhoE
LTHDSTNTRRLLLVRHGLPDYRDGKAGDEPPGPPLSDIGRQQAAQAAAALRECAAVRVHCSPLARTQQTAQRIQQTLNVPLRIDGDLGEWHRTEGLHEVSVRLTRWFVHWLRGDEPCAVVVSHASPLLAILRSALYLPHAAWHKAGRPEALVVATADRFEVSMGAVFELVIDPRSVTARCLFHPRPRVHHLRQKVACPRLPQIVPGSGESRYLQRRNWLRLVGG